jgi:hypothetical protein
MSFQADSQAALDALGRAGLLGDLFSFDKITNTNLLVGTDCTPLWGTNTACENTALCCEDNYQNGLLAVGCTNLILPIGM